MQLQKYSLRILLVIMAAIIIFLDIVTRGAEIAVERNTPITNLAKNGSFELIDGNRPVGWISKGDNSIAQKLTIDGGRKNGLSAKLVCSSFTRLSRESHASLVQTNQIKVTQGQWYRFSCWIRAENLNSGLVRIGIYDNDYYEQEIGLYKQIAARRHWQKFEHYFVAKRSIENNSCLKFWIVETGTIWLDDVELVPVEPVNSHFTQVVPSIKSKNLVPNSSFECGIDGWSSIGKPTGWATSLTSLYGDISEEDAWHGNSCLRIDLSPSDTPVTYYDGFPPVRLEQKSPLAANSGWIRVKKGNLYSLSAVMKADREKVPAKLEFHFKTPGSRSRKQSQSIQLSTHWERYSFSVKALEDNVFIALGPDLMGTDKDTATVWIDAVQLEQNTKPSEFEPKASVEIGIQTEKLGNVFELDDPVRLILHSYNNTDYPASAAVHVKLNDYFDNCKESLSFSLDIPAKSNTTMYKSLGILDTGYFRANISWKLSGQGVEIKAAKENSCLLRLAVIKSYQGKDSIFGLNHAPVTAEMGHLARRAGCTWARDWSMKWEYLQPQADMDIKFEVSDPQVQRIEAVKMNVLPMLPPFPSSNWSSSAPDGVVDQLKRKDWKSRIKMSFSPRRPKILATFIEKVVTYYRDRIKVWDFINEPLYTVYSLPAQDQMDSIMPGLIGANHSLEDYVSLLKLAYTAMKKADPTCQVIGGLGGRPDLLSRELFEYGAMDYMDIFNLHIYPGLRKPEVYISLMGELLKNMDCHNQRKPIWITEFAYYGADELPWQPFYNYKGWAAPRLLENEKQCADYLVRFSTIMLAHGVEKIFFHSGMGISSQVNDSLAALGGSWMMGHGGLPRKAYPALSVLANFLGTNPRFDAPLTKFSFGNYDMDGNVFGYAFQCGKNAVLVAWAQESERDHVKWLLESPSNTMVYNIMGSQINGNRIKLSESPVYFVSSTTTAKDLAQQCRLHTSE